jgi:hypothetical protein
MTAAAQAGATVGFPIAGHMREATGSRYPSALK